MTTDPLDRLLALCDAAKTAEPGSDGVLTIVDGEERNVWTKADLDFIEAATPDRVKLLVLTVKAAKQDFIECSATSAANLEAAIAAVEEAFK